MENAQSFRRRRERILVDDVVIVTDAVLLLGGGGGGHASSSSRSESAVVRFIRENRNRAFSLSFLILECVEREKPISKISTSLLLLVGENFSLFKKRALDSRLLLLSSS
jgi:hypothetical protein